MAVPNPYRLTAYDKMLMQKRSDRELAADDPEWVELQQRRQGAWDFPGGGTPTPLSTYDRGLVQAVTDGELGRDDPDYMDVVQGMQLSPSRSLIDVPVPPDTTSAVLSAAVLNQWDRITRLSFTAGCTAQATQVTQGSNT